MSYFAYELQPALVSARQWLVTWDNYTAVLLELEVQELLLLRNEADFGLWGLMQLLPRLIIAAGQLSSLRHVALLSLVRVEQIGSLNLLHHGH